MLGSIWSTLSPYLVSVLAPILVLGFLIFVHELGHFLACKRVGVGVLKFSLGFGPAVLSRIVGGTEYCLSAIPLGGFVKMVGDESDEDVDQASIDAPDSFARKPLAGRAFIVLAGPLGNLIFSSLLFMILFTSGIPLLTATIGGIEENSPAAAAGIKIGDKIVAIDGQPIVKWDDLAAGIRSSGGKAVRLNVARGEEKLELSVTPAAAEGKTIFGEVIPSYQIGVKPSGDHILERSNPIVAIGKGFYETAQLSGLTLLSIAKLFQGVVPASTVRGPISIIQMAGQQASEGIPALLYFMAILSINLGVLNLLPVPVLDGGHLLIMGIELLRGRPLALRHREIAQQIGLVLLVSLMGFALYNDLFSSSAG